MDKINPAAQRLQHYGYGAWDLSRSRGKWAGHWRKVSIAARPGRCRLTPASPSMPMGCGPVPPAVPSCSHPWQIVGSPSHGTPFPWCHESRACSLPCNSDLLSSSQTMRPCRDQAGTNSPWTCVPYPGPRFLLARPHMDSQDISQWRTATQRCRVPSAQFHMLENVEMLESVRNRRRAGARACSFLHAPPGGMNPPGRCFRQLWLIPASQAVQVIGS